MSMSLFFSLFYEDGSVGLKAMRTMQVRLTPHVGIAMALYYHKDALFYRMLSRVLVDIQISIGYVKGAGHIQKTLEIKPREYAIGPAMSRPNDFRGSFTSIHLCSWRSSCNPSCCQLCATMIVVHLFDIRSIW